MLDDGACRTHGGNDHAAHMVARGPTRRGDSDSEHGSCARAADVRSVWQPDARRNPRRAFKRRRRVRPGNHRPESRRGRHGDGQRALRARRAPAGSVRRRRYGRYRVRRQSKCGGRRNRLDGPGDDRIGSWRTGRPRRHVEHVWSRRHQRPGWPVRRSRDEPRPTRPDGSVRHEPEHAREQPSAARADHRRLYAAIGSQHRHHLAARTPPHQDPPAPSEAGAGGDGGRYGCAAGDSADGAGSRSSRAIGPPRARDLGRSK